jgi:hypothetical protein
MGLQDNMQRWASKRAWKQIMDTPDLPLEMRKIINDCLIPMCVHPAKWVENTVWLETHGMPELQGVKNPRPTPSVLEFKRPMDRPRGYPTWFLAAFPDVASWASKLMADADLGGDARAVEMKENLYARYLTVYPGDLYEAVDGKLSLPFLKNLAEFYMNCKGSRPECRL